MSRLSWPALSSEELMQQWMMNSWFFLIFYIVHSSGIKCNGALVSYGLFADFCFVVLVPPPLPLPLPPGGEFSRGRKSPAVCLGQSRVEGRKTERKEWKWISRNMYLHPLSWLNSYCCEPGLMACDPEGFLLWLDPALCCLRDLGWAELRHTGSSLSSANDSWPLTAFCSI